MKLSNIKGQQINNHCEVVEDIGDILEMIPKQEEN